MVRSYMQTYEDMDIFITHCANNYGPYQFPEKLIPLSIINVLQGRKIRLYGDGLQSRDWLHVLDHCRAIDLVLHKAQAKENALPIYDISARREVTNQHIAQLLIRFLGKKYEDCVEHVTDRPNHDRRYLIEPRKIENELGFKPSIEFEQGIEETVKWYVDHPDWWRGIMENSSTFVFDWSKSA